VQVRELNSINQSINTFITRHGTELSKLISRFSQSLKQTITATFSGSKEDQLLTIMHPDELSLA